MGGAEDAAQRAGVLVLARREPYLRASLDAIRDREKLWFYHDGRPVGFCCPRVVRDHLRIGPVYMLPALRRQGIARSAMQQYLAGQRGELRALVENGNAAAEALFTALGYAPTGSWIRRCRVWKRGAAA